MKKVNKSALIRKLYDEGKSIKEIKEKVKCSSALIAIVLRKHKKKVKQSKIIQAVTEVKQALDKIESKPTKLFIQPQYKDAAMKLLAANDLVNHPPHYKAGGIETIDFIEAKDLNYRLGNVIKYVARAGKKHTDPVEDLKKARFYLDREINIRERA